MVTKNCEQCGALMVDVHHKQRFCTDCIKIRNKESQARYMERRKYGTPLDPTGYCALCDEPIWDKRNTLCDYCKSKIAQSRHRTTEKKVKEKKKPLRHCWDLRNKTAVQIDIEARSLGLTYGQYSSLIETLMIERYLADNGITDGLDRIDKAWREFKHNKREQDRRIKESIARAKATGREEAEDDMVY